jgi:lipopolysaccharide/colanic/teichoic acid biosynthesis glycosyltransferase
MMNSTNSLFELCRPPWIDALPEALRLGRDILLAALGLLLLWPVFLLIALAIRLDSPGPVLYRQTRLGRGGRPFTLLKFRSMRLDADSQLGALLETSPEFRRAWARHQKLWNDPRCTPLGIFLRRSSLDELPQLWNVLRGEMSLVGPRPILPDQRLQYGPFFECYASLRPGLTGLWQVMGRNQISFAGRVFLDQVYISRRSLALDAYILLRTTWVVLTCLGAS